VTNRREQRTTSIRLSAELEAKVEERKNFGLATSMNRVIERDLERYYRLLDDALAHVKQSLSDDEQALIIDCLNGVLMDSHTIRLLPHQISDGISMEHLDRKWEVDGQALVEKLETMTPFELAAVVDGAERFWAAVGNGEDRDPRGGL